MKGKGFSWMIAVAAAPPPPPPPLAPSSSSTKLTRVAKQSTVGTARSIHTETQAAMHRTPSLDCWLQLAIVQPSPPSSFLLFPHLSFFLQFAQAASFNLCGCFFLCGLVVGS